MNVMLRNTVIFVGVYLVALVAALLYEGVHADAQMVAKHQSLVAQPHMARH